MDIAIYCGLALVVLALIVVAARLRRGDDHATTASDNPGTADKTPRASLEECLKAVQAQECCGTHEVCEKEQMIRALREEIEYFNDEELDAYIGTPADAYTDEQADEFRDVLYTMDPNETEDWLRSLELRGVELPMALKEEVCSLIADTRQKRMAARQ